MTIGIPTGNSLDMKLEFFSQFHILLSYNALLRALTPNGGPKSQRLSQLLFMIFQSPDYIK